MPRNLVGVVGGEGSPGTLHWRWLPPRNTLTGPFEDIPQEQIKTKSDWKTRLSEIACIMAEPGEHLVDGVHLRCTESRLGKHFSI